MLLEKKIKIRKIVDGGVWDSFVSSSLHGTVFSTKSWLDASAAAQGGTPVILGAWDGDIMIAGIAFTEVVKGPLRKANTPVLAPYGGFMYNVNSNDAGKDTGSLQLLCAEKLIDYFQRRYHYVLLSHAPAFNDIRPFSWSGWSEKVRYTYLLDISDPDRLWDNSRDRARRRIRKANENLKIGGPVDAEMVAGFHERFFRDRGRIPPVPRKVVISIVDTLEGSGLIDVNTVNDKKGNIIALQVAVLGYDTIYTSLYGTLPNTGYSGADSLLIWNAVEKYSSTHKWLDLVGANIPSIAFFKKGFGGMLTPHYVTEYYSSPWAHTAFSIYAHIRKYF